MSTTCPLPKAFSSLRHHSDLLDDAEAQQFFAVADAIGKLQPRAAVLENVPGLSQVIDKIMARLRRCGRYLVVNITIDPASLGTDLSRPRIYILMVHKSVLQGETEQSLLGIFERRLETVERFFQGLGGAKRKWEELLFDEMSSPVQEWRQAKKLQNGPVASREILQCKVHARFRKFVVQGCAHSPVDTYRRVPSK